MFRHRRQSPPRALAAAALALLTAGCFSDDASVLPENANSLRLRSVRVDASTCIHRDGSEVECLTADAKDLRRVAELRGVIGAPTRAIELDNDSRMKAPDLNNGREPTFNTLSTFYARMPFGYGCEATLQGMFKDDPTGDPLGDRIDDVANYELGAFTRVLGAIRSHNAVPIWTAGYGLGTLGDGDTCSYAAHQTQGFDQTLGAFEPVPEQTGPTLTADGARRWARVVRRVAKYFNREYPQLNKDTGAACPQTDWAPAGYAGMNLLWCERESLLNIEFGRDPLGAGGFPDMATLRAYYEEFTAELRDEFPWPGNDVFLFAPSIVVRSEETLDTAIGSPGRSPLFDFIDDAVTDKDKPGGQPLNFVSFEIVAKSAAEVRQVVTAIRTYVDDVGLTDKLGRPMQLFITDLRLDNDALPPSVRDNPVRLSAYEGAFYASSKMLVQGLVSGATIGRVVRFPTETGSADDIAASALDSNLLWFGSDTVPDGALKPAAWHAFWFNEAYLGRGGGALDEYCDPQADPEACADIAASQRKKSIVRVEHGPDALGLAGTKSIDTRKGLVALATRESCVTSTGQPRDCVVEVDAQGNPAPTFPAATQGRQRILRIMLADLDPSATGNGDGEAIEHRIRLQVDGLPPETKTVGYRWARMDASDPTWTSYFFLEQGVLDSAAGRTQLTFDASVPSTHYFELLY